MKAVSPSRALRIDAIRLNVADLPAAMTFYQAGLGFTVETHDPGLATLTLGGERLELVQAPLAAAAYPPDPLANDPWFQHFAIRVSDMSAAYSRLTTQRFTAISLGGPQQLPPSTGSVIAYKFRDPDGHPLELSFVPDAHDEPGASPFVTIDHSAIAVSDIERSLEFWSGRLGLVETARLLNHGPTQWRLDGLEEALVDIIVLEPPGGGPHIELLHYRVPLSNRRPRPFSRTDIPATLLKLRVGGELTSNDGDHAMADPDGHWVAGPF